MREDVVPPDSATLARYLSGEANAAETARVERWLAGDAANRKLLDSVRTVWNRGEPSEFDPDDALWSRVAARLERRLPKPALVRERHRMATRIVRPLLTRRAWAWPAAAAVVVAIGSAVLVAKLRRPPAPPAMREVATRRGQRAALDLPDGSRVVLAPDSRLRYAATYGTRRRGAGRDLFIEGQGYFAVQHDSTRPFRVHTATGVAEDVGTEFVVTAYPEKPRTDVVVVSGVVAVRRPHASDVRPLLTLTRGDLGRIDSSGTAILTRNVNLEPYVAWTTGGLVFDGTPLRDAVPALERWYDLEVRLADSALAERRLTASFHHEPASQVLELVARSLNARVEQRGRQVVFSSGTP